jgi:hypothetical protein
MRKVFAVHKVRDEVNKKLVGLLQSVILHDSTFHSIVRQKAPSLVLVLKV